MTDHNSRTVNSRRRFLRNAGALALTTTPLGSRAAKEVAEGVTFAGGPRSLVRFPEKRELILVHNRPPHLETPFSVYNEGVITANDAFYVRYHLANFPTSINLDDYRLNIRGAVKKTLNLSLTELKAMAQQLDVVAVNQCSGNSRGFSSPRVFGAQLANGAMGNARWTGVSLKAVLEKAGVMSDARQVSFNGLDKPVLSATPDFRKTLDIDHALSGEPMLAWGMNGEDLPFLNGYPLKLIVPGYFGTYWVKHLSEIVVLDHTFKGHNAFYMNKAYQVPDNDCLCIVPGTTAAQTRPISILPVRSFITSVVSGDQIPVARRIELKGIAFDSGAGLKAVDVSIDGGRTWRTAKMSESLGRFSFREWKLTTTFAVKGNAVLMVRASNNNGEIQPLDADWNPAGYRRHAIESTPVTIV